MTSPWRQAFPALRNHDVAYLDHAATCQIPDVVLEAMFSYESAGRANAHRGLYPWSARATEAFEAARLDVARFVNADPTRLIFTKGTTDGLNMVARSIGERLGPGDEVIVTLADHHASVLPWRVLSAQRGFIVRTLSVTPTGEIAIDRLREMIGPRTRVVALPMVSNVLGSMFPVEDVVRVASQVGALVVVDAAQAVGHIPVDFGGLGCDAVAFGAHKMYGPTGIGALAVSERLWNTLVPSTFGGGMVDSAERLMWRGDVARFEAGTQHVAGAIGFSAAAQWLAGIGWQAIRLHETALTERLLESLRRQDVRLIGPIGPIGRIGLVSFNLDEVHAHDVAEILGRRDVCVRAGHHCAEPLANAMAPSGSVRVSLGLPNDERDVERLLEGLHEAKRVFGYA